MPDSYYNRKVKHSDVIVIGGGVIGLSLALRLKQQSLSVLVVEKREPASEATYAAGGMIAHCDPHTPAALLPLVRRSAEMYAEFVHDVEAESGEKIDFRTIGTIAVLQENEIPLCDEARPIGAPDISALEPSLRLGETAWFLPEPCVDPRDLGHALEKAARHLDVDFVTGSAVLEVLAENNRATGVRTAHATYHASVVLNCAGAWAAQITPLAIPTRPVKGQMVCLVPQFSPSSGLTWADHVLIRHVIRTPDIYIIPRSDGRILLGATVEEAGFDKQTNPDMIKRMFDAAMHIAPVLDSTRMHDAWAGLRPGTPDSLPILGETTIKGYFAATGHFRDGIMLAPATAEVMTQLITGSKPAIDLAPFSPERFL
jgi:glycine oxidase